MVQIAVVTGSNRGIGLSLCKTLKSKGFNVYGACRKSSPGLEAAVGASNVIPGVDVGVDGGVAPLSKALGSQKVDLLVCNAGILVRDTLEDVTIDSIREQFEVNTLGPLRTYQGLKDNLQKGSKLVIITSRMGSIADNTSGGYYGYRISKAGVNMLGMDLSRDLAEKGIAVGILHPGFVATDMTAKYGSQGLDSPDDAAADLVNVALSKLDMASSGTFWHRNGSVLPW